MHRLLLMGVSGSGKSTLGPLLGAALGVPFADADAFHPPANIEKMSRGEPLTDADRAPWLAALGAWLAGQAGGGIIGCSALKRAYRDALRAAAPGLRLLFLAGPPALIAARQAARPGHFMPASLMDSQFATLEHPAPEEDAIILDIAQPPVALLRAALAALPPAQPR
ncbi:gluconokinase [Rhodovarius lipocyclicus]|uniref:gluconokinase n=1 Tax=Rhodovarius lipocyclicus TaxID=268410 RepID=UPI00135BD5C6|nr:gluconokinase [Rhodovarius lipocyclicus]